MRIASILVLVLALATSACQTVSPDGNGAGVSLQYGPVAAN